MGSKRTEVRVVIPDAHIQAHHHKAFQTLVAVIKDLRPHRLIWIGDWVDNYSLTHHPKRQPGVVRFVDEFGEAERETDRVCNAAPNAEKHMLEGNHEGWLRGFEAENPSLEHALSIPERLKLQEKGIRWVNLFQQDKFRIGPVAYLHGVYEGPNASRKHAELFGPRIGCKHVVHGHDHGMNSFTTPAGYTARSCGFLGDERNIAFSYRKGRPSAWVLGFLVQEVNGSSVTDTEVRIDYSTGRAAFRGRVYGAH